MLSLLIMGGNIQGNNIESESRSDLETRSKSKKESGLELAKGKISLEECRALALKNNRELERSALDQKSGEAAVAMAKKGYLPKLEAIAMGGYIGNIDGDIDIPSMALPVTDGAGNTTGNSANTPPLSYSIESMTFLNVGVTISQPIYMGGEIKAYNSKAKIGEQMAKEALHLTESNLTHRVDEAYWNLVAVRGAVKLTNSYIAVLTELEEQLDQMYSLGLLPKSELLKVRLEKNKAAQNLVKVEHGNLLAMYNLNQMVGIPLTATTTPSDSLDIDMISTVNTDNEVVTAVDRRSEIKLLKSQIDLAEADKKIDMAGYKPKALLTVGGVYLYMSDLAEDLSPVTTAMGAVSIPIFHWGEKRDKRTIADNNIAKAESNYAEKRELIKLEIIKVAQELNECYSSVDLAQEGVDTAKETAEEVKISFDASLNTTADLLSAQADRQSANYQLLVAIKEYKVKESDWRRVTGGK